MRCQRCHKSLEDNPKFCVHCGTKIEPVNAQEEEIGAVDQYFFNTRNKCQHCGQIKPLKKVHFYKNIGMLLARRNQEIQGYFCKSCINKLFREYFLTDLFLGWWGTISFIITPFYLLFNLWYFLPSIFLKKEFDSKG